MASQDWYARQNGKVVGPFSSAKMKLLASEGRLPRDSEVASSPDGPWQVAARVRGLTFPEPAAPMVYDAPPVRREKPQAVRGHVTIEKTGKWLKAQLVLSFLLLLAGVITIIVKAQELPSSEPDRSMAYGPLMVVVGILWWIMTKVRVWWQHG
jgi:hypothetical protein